MEDDRRDGRQAQATASLPTSPTIPDSRHSSCDLSEDTCTLPPTGSALTQDTRDATSPEAAQVYALDDDASEIDHLYAATLSRPSSVVASETYSNHDQSAYALHPAQHSQKKAGEGAIRSPPAPGYWKPFWLRQSTLLALTALLVALLVSLVVLWYADKSGNGFRLSLSTSHCAWTYSPTAILAIILSFWRQVDYHTKLLQPWSELRRTFNPAESSILLDYLSPLQITSFVHAVRRRHAPVAASIAGFAILKAVILLSTGLLILAPVTVTESSPVTLTRRFDSAPFWATVPDGASVDVNPFGRPSAAYSNVSGHSAHAYLQSLGNGALATTGIAYGMVFESFEAAAVADPVTVSTNVSVFVPKASCEIARPTTRMLGAGSMLVQLDSDTCSVGAEHQDRMYVEASNDSCTDDCMSFVTYKLWRVNCSTTQNSSDSSPIDVNTPYDFRFALLVGNMSLAPLAYDDYLGREIRKPAMQQAASVICSVDYTMHESKVLHNITDDQFSISHMRLLPNFDDLTSTMLGEMVFTALAGSTGLALDEYGDNVFPGPADPTYFIILQTLNGTRSMDRLLSEETLQSSASQAWAGIAAHFTQENFLTPERTNISGTITRMENRLQVGHVAVWLMVAGVALTIVLTVSIMLTMVRDTVPLDPDSLSSDAMVLAASPSLENLFLQSGHARTSQLTATLQRFKFGATISNQYKIQIVDNDVLNTDKELKTKPKAWLPLAAKRPMILLTLAAPLAAVVVLEVLYRISLAERGFIDVSGSETTASYVSRYLSALVALLIATCFNGLDFTIALFAPYTFLRSEAVPPERSVDLQILGKLPPLALLQSMRVRHASSFFSKLAAITGSVLTIIASGLWIIDREVVVEQDVQVSQLNYWDSEWFNSSSTKDGGAGALFDQIQHGGANMPDKIWRDIVIPDAMNIRALAENQPTFTLGADKAQNYTFEVVGLRPLLDCEAIADEHITIQFSVEYTYDLLIVHAFPPLPPKCQTGGENGTDDYYYFASSYSSGTSHEIEFIGGFYDLHLGPWTKDPQHAYGENFDNLAYQADNPAGCPSIGAIFAQSFGNDTNYDNVMAIMCSQKIQEVPLEVTYSGMDTDTPTISTDTAPIVLENKVRNRTNGTDGIDTFPYRVQTYLQETPVGNLTRFTLGSKNDGTMEALSDFMNHLVYGPDGIPPQDLFSQGNAGAFIQAVQKQYAKYMSLVIDMRCRKPIELVDETPLLGTAKAFTSRIRVNQASKLTLQIMLGVMAALATLAYVLTDLRGTLPRKPSFIASRMALLAGSDLVQELRTLLPIGPLAACEETNQVFKGGLFSLGWWHQRRTEDPAPENHASEDELRSPEEQGMEARRFGVDLGAVEQLGFRETRWYTVRKRLTKRHLETEKMSE